jgi:Icc-related predicted phosphoesterase
MTSAAKAPVRVAALGDLHFGKNSPGTFNQLFGQISERADVLMLCGDFTDYGTTDEAKALAKDIASALRIPMLAVLGNHDYHGGKAEEITAIFRDAGVVVLDGDSHELLGVGFAGVKGFGGGFGPRALGPWGEETFKRFVHEAVEEALKLEAALARLRTPSRLVLLHYAPVRETCEGEPLEIFPFLGSSRLEEPINRYKVSAVVHGHAHRGQLEGRTSTGVPVYNVCLPLLARLTPEQPFRVLEVPTAESLAAAAPPDAGGSGPAPAPPPVTPPPTPVTAG